LPPGVAASASGLEPQTGRDFGRGCAMLNMPTSNMKAAIRRDVLRQGRESGANQGRGIQRNSDEWFQGKRPKLKL